MGKPRGLRTARKHANHRHEQRWNDEDYKKAHLRTRWKANPFEGASHATGIILKKIGVKAKQPNSAIRKRVRVQLIKNGKKVTAFVPRDGCLNMIEENHDILVAKFGRLSFVSFCSGFFLNTLTGKASSLLQWQMDLYFASAIEIYQSVSGVDNRILNVN